MCFATLQILSTSETLPRMKLDGIYPLLLSIRLRRFRKRSFIVRKRFGVAGSNVDDESMHSFERMEAALFSLSVNYSTNSRCNLTTPLSNSSFITKWDPRPKYSSPRVQYHSGESESSAESRIASLSTSKSCSQFASVCALYCKDFVT